MGMSASSGSSKKGGVVPVMNVTPLVDVVLVLLIIFMVVTPLLTKQLWLNVPKKDEKAKDEPPPPDNENRPVVITVDKAGTIMINQHVVTRNELQGKLDRIFAARKDKLIYFDADNEAPFGVAVDVMDIAKLGGSRSIAILTEKPGT